MDAPIGELIRTARQGDGAAAEQLFASLYRELHSIAERQIRRGGSNLTLGTTTLLHEAYLKIAAREGVEFADRGHFLSYASRAMRGLTIDYVRRRQARKRGGEFHITSASGDEPAVGHEPSAGSDVSTAALEDLSAALDELAAVNPQLAELVDLHFFCGFSLVELAGMRGVTERTVQRDWRKARLLLHHAMRSL